MSKKPFALIAALLCLALLGGCGQAVGTSNTATGTVTDTNTQANESATQNFGTSAEASTAGTTAENTQSTSAPETSSATTTKPTTTNERKIQKMLNTQRFVSPAAGANDFAFRLSRALLQTTGKKNFVSSPYSVWLPLAALVNGTDAAHRPALLASLGAEGFSEDELDDAAAQALAALTHAEQKGSEYYHNPLQIANAVFVDKKAKLKPSFAQNFSVNYMGKAFAVDFSSPGAVKTVNDWASKNTNGLIKEIIKEFDPATVAAIANAIYFSDRWEREFNPDQTKKDTFHGTNGDSEAHFMLREGNNQAYYEDSKLQAMPLEFKTGGGLCILLPKAGNANALLSSMDSAYFKKIQSDASPATGKLLLPRFSIDSGSMKLEDALTALGVPLFDPAASPLNGVLEGNIPLYLSGAVQKAVIKVDEKGTTAAAVTVMVMTGAALPKPTPPFSMICDRPFAFVLYGDGGQILFTGVVNQC